VREVELESEIALRDLEVERNDLESRRAEVQTEVDRLGEPPANVQSHRTFGRFWLAFFVLASMVSGLGVAWSLGELVTLAWWERGLIVVSTFVVSVVGWVAFLLHLRDRIRGRLLQIIAGLGLVMALCGLTTVTLLGIGRAAIGVVREEQAQTASLRTDGELDAAPADTSAEASKVARVKVLLNVVMALAAVLIAVGGELGAGVAGHEYLRRMTVVWTTAPFHRELDRLAGRLRQNARAQEAARRAAELHYARFTAARLREEVEAARWDEEAEKRAASLGPVLRWVLVVATVGFVVLLGGLWYAFADEGPREVTVVILDVSASVAAGDEFARNVQAVEGLLRRIETSGARVVVLCVAEASFGLAPVFGEVSPRERGRFGEYLQTWRRAAIGRWRTVSQQLTPSARGSDIIGALGRAAVEFDGPPMSMKRVIMLSDMRQFGRGFDLERLTGDPVAAAARADRLGLVPKLPAVNVWALGVHTYGIDEQQWGRLRTFWSEFFSRAGAGLRAFTPSRRVGAW
jgi:hypothetical protein